MAAIVLVQMAALGLEIFLGYETETARSVLGLEEFRGCGAAISR
jgi:hypothetical protein